MGVKDDSMSQVDRREDRDSVLDSTMRGPRPGCNKCRIADPGWFDKAVDVEARKAFDICIWPALFFREEAASIILECSG